MEGGSGHFWREGQVNGPPVTVVMATYNGEAFIAEQLDSIMGQTYSAAEIVVVDDGSTDRTLEIVAAYNSGRILIHRNLVNLGVQGSFATGIALASHELIALCDQDDIWVPERLQTLVGAIDGCDVAFSDAELVDGAGAALGERLSDRVPGYGAELSQRDFPFMLFNSHMWGSTALVRKSLYSRYQPVAVTYRNHDWWLQISAAFGSGSRYVAKPLTLRRIHSKNYSVNKKPSLLSKLIQRTWFRRSPSSVADQSALLSAVAASGLPLEKGQRQMLLEAIEAYAAGPSFKLAMFSFRWRKLIFWGRSPTQQIILALSRW